MKINFHVYRREPERWLLISGGVIAAALWIITAKLIQHQAEVTPLHYTIYFGIDLSGPASRLWLLPGFATLSWWSHIFIGQLTTDGVWTRTWLILNIVIELLLGMALFFLWFTAQPA